MLQGWDDPNSPEQTILLPPVLHSKQMNGKSSKIVAVRQLPPLKSNSQPKAYRSCQDCSSLPFNFIASSIVKQKVSQPLRTRQTEKEALPEIRPRGKTQFEQSKESPKGRLVERLLGRFSKQMVELKSKFTRQPIRRRLLH